MSSPFLKLPPEGEGLKPVEGNASSQTDASSCQAPETSLLVIGGIEVDLSAESVRSSGRDVRLPEGEFKLLTVLMSDPGTAFPREQLAEILWPDRIFLDLRTVDQKIRRLRAALNRGPAPDPIRSVRGKGYKFSESYEREYALWLNSGRKKYHMDEIVQKRKRVKREDR